MGHYTDALEDNLLGLTDKDALNEQEELGIATVERFLLKELAYSVDLSVALLQELHRRAFRHLYDRAGQLRRTVPNVGPTCQSLRPGCHNSCRSLSTSCAIGKACCLLHHAPNK
jgi:fido (protein-threonine AMPylation protein)